MQTGQYSERPSVTHFKAWVAVGEARLLCRQVPWLGKGQAHTPHCGLCHSGQGAELAIRETWSQSGLSRLVPSLWPGACFLFCFESGRGNINVSHTVKLQRAGSCLTHPRSSDSPFIPFSCQGQSQVSQVPTNLNTNRRVQPFKGTAKSWDGVVPGPAFSQTLEEHWQS